MPYHQPSIQPPQGCGCLRFIYPPVCQALNKLEVVAGSAPPCASVSLYLDGQLVQQVISNHCGYWQAVLADPPAKGPHTLQAVSGCREITRIIVIRSGRAPLSAPEILYPSGVISQSAPLIRGAAQPGVTVRVRVDQACCQTLPVGADGAWSWQYPSRLEAGGHVVIAVAVDASDCESDPAFQFFQIQDAPVLDAALSRARAGSSFRTVALDLRLCSTAYPVTLHYLLLPPGSPAPSADEVLSYAGSGLADGTAATGSIPLLAGGCVTVNVTGRENAPAGALGVVDGLRYDVYLVVRADGAQSSVLSAANVPAMPFAGGCGTDCDPYQIAALSPEDIRDKYPDLAADRSPLGVDDTARMLRNLDNLEALYTRSLGLYGVQDSMQLAYRLVTPLDLSGYAAANNGTGWPPLGGRGESGDPLPFSGQLSGDGASTAIRGLTVVKNTFRRWEGLFIQSADAAFCGITLEDAVIRLTLASEEARNDTAIGLLAVNIKGGTLRDVTVSNAEITTAGPEEGSAYVTVGAIAASVDRLVSGECLRVRGLHLTQRRQGGVYAPSGGMFGRVGADAYESGFPGSMLDGLVVEDSTFDLQGSVGGIAGEISAGLSMRNAACRRCTFIGQGWIGGVAGTVYSGFFSLNLECLESRNNVFTLPADNGGNRYGGMFGRVLLESEAVALRSLRCVSNTITGGSVTGGLAGELNFHTAFLAEDCHVIGARLRDASVQAGGFAGRIVDTLVNAQTGDSGVLRDCSVRGAVIEGLSGAGGFVGGCVLNENTGTYPLALLFQGCSSQIDLISTSAPCGGFAGLCGVGAFTGCRAEGRVGGSALTGGFVGQILAQRFDAARSMTSCAANVAVYQTGAATDGGFGGFAGQLTDTDVSQCLSTGAVTCVARSSGAFAGTLTGGALYDCYAVGTLNAQASAGGMFGLSDSGTVQRCYCQGTVAGAAGTGGIGGACTGAETSVSGCLVLSPSISGGTPTSRVLGAPGGAALRGNYATTSQVLQDGQAKPVSNNPSGPDGGSIAADQIVSTMQAAGWSAQIWDYDSVFDASGPKLRNTPETA